MIFVAFNGINYYKVSMRIFIRLERCKNMESKFVRNFEYEKLKFFSWIRCSQDFQNLIN